MKRAERSFDSVRRVPRNGAREKSGRRCAQDDGWMLGRDCERRVGDGAREKTAPLKTKGAGPCSAEAVCCADLPGSCGRRAPAATCK